MADRLGTDGMAAVRAHAFFDGLDGDALYSTAPPPRRWRGAAQPNATWSRRQNSISVVAAAPALRIWEDGDAGGGLDALAETADEASAPFVARPSVRSREDTAPTEEPAFRPMEGIEEEPADGRRSHAVRGARVAPHEAAVSIGMPPPRGVPLRGVAMDIS